MHSIIAFLNNFNSYEGPINEATIRDQK
ncbi:ribose-phosphate pyrophosphokinase [Maribacter sp. HTCC2170]|nr:ribose-phosphate pyrophosphokinase [Maribacter sp. HTCC2170]